MAPTWGRPTRNVRAAAGELLLCSQSQLGRRRRKGGRLAVSALRYGNGRNARMRLLEPPPLCCLRTPSPKPNSNLRVPGQEPYRAGCSDSSESSWQRCRCPDRYLRPRLVSGERGYHRRPSWRGTEVRGKGTDEVRVASCPRK